MNSVPYILRFFQYNGVLGFWGPEGYLIIKIHMIIYRKLLRLLKSMLVQQVERLQMSLSNQEIEQVMETPSNDSH